VRRHALHLLAAVLLLLAGAPAGLAGAEECEVFLSLDGGAACTAPARSELPPPGASALSFQPAGQTGQPFQASLHALAAVRLLIHRFNE
jgi:hypothetical protein